MSFESLNWRGATLRVEIKASTLRVSQLTDGRHPMALKDHKGEMHPLGVGGAPVVLSRDGTVRVVEQL